jgi:hypothetical protein
MTYTLTPEQIETRARALSDKLEALLGLDTLRTCIALNATPEYQIGACATQEHCDTNQLLIDVMHAEDPDLPEDWEPYHFQAAGQIYDLAHASNFYR